MILGGVLGLGKCRAEGLWCGATSCWRGFGEVLGWGSNEKN